jgi:hypothetical protein
MTTKEAHLQILRSALSESSSLIHSEPDLASFIGRGFSGTPFRLGDGATLSLTITEQVAATASPQEMEALRNIARKSIAKALQTNKDVLGGLILGHAKKGLNYFDYA